MRTIFTFILRLLLDPAEPNALRGALQPLPDGDPQPFVDASALLELLRTTVLTIQPADDPHEEERL